MRKTILVIFFIFTIVTFTLLNVSLKKDASNIDIKIQHIEAFGENEEGWTDPCTSPGGICMTYDENGDPLFHAGLHIP